MTLVHLKLGLLLVGLGTWYWGYRVDNTAVRWLGIAFLLAAFVLRFVERKRTISQPDEPADRPR